MTVSKFEDEIKKAKDYEDRIALYESHLNDAMSAWFKARQGKILKCYEHEFLFEGGFRMAWELFRGGQR